MKREFLSLLLFLGFVALALFLATGCGTMEEHQTLDPDILYYPDLDVEVDGKSYGSWGVLPEHFPPKIKIKSPGDIDQIRISTCGRSELLPKQGGLFSSNKRYTYHYTPNSEESTQRVRFGESCGILIETFEEGKEARHSWATFDFEDQKNYKVTAQVACCGKDLSYEGVSACVCGKNTLSGLRFSEPVRPLSDTPQCKAGWEEHEGGRYWRRQLARGECPYLFVGEDNALRQHRHTQIGVDSYPIRGK